MDKKGGERSQKVKHREGKPRKMRDRRGTLYAERTTTNTTTYKLDTVDLGIPSRKQDLVGMDSEDEKSRQ